jgi:hypothetical protein
MGGTANEVQKIFAGSYGVFNPAVLGSSPHGRERAMNTRGRFLTPGRKYKYLPRFGRDVLEAEFVRRIPREPGRAAINVFIVPAFAGLNGPADKGITHFNDHSVAKQIQIIPTCKH